MASLALLLLLTWILVQALPASSTIISSNVAFQPIKRVSPSHAKWIISVTTGPNNQKQHIQALLQDVRAISVVANHLSSKITFRNDTVIDQFKRELLRSVSLLQETQEQYNELGHLLMKPDTDIPHTSRSKRSLLPFVGGALSALFGTVSTSELDKVKRNLGKLRENEKEIVHVLQDNLSMVKTSSKQIQENRKSLNQISIGLKKFHRNMEYVTNTLNDDLTTAKLTTKAYFQLRFVNSHIKSLLSQIKYDLLELKTKLNSLAMQRLTPSIIPPNQLIKILNQISLILPSSLNLPLRPELNLWSYYHSLTCNTVTNGDTLVIMIGIPLLSSTENYELMKVHNLPLPMPRINASSTVVAKYITEADSIAVNRVQGKYILLTKQEYNTCERSPLGFCSTREPIYPLNMNAHCVIALYKGDHEATNRLCKTTVLINTQLPSAQQLTEGNWAISTLNPLELTIKCPGEAPKKNLINPPIEIVRLQMQCSANSDSIYLPPFFVGKSAISLNHTNTVSFTRIKFPDLSLWTPLTDHLPKLKEITWPKELDKINTIELNPFIERLLNAQQTNSPPENANWTYVSAISLALSISILLGITIMYIRIKVQGLLLKDKEEIPKQIPQTDQDIECPHSENCPNAASPDTSIKESRYQ